MTIALARIRSSADKLFTGYASPALVGLAALLLRLYRLGRSPFWFDELFIYEISLQSPSVIIRQAWYEPYPSLYYFLAKVTSGFGLVHAEWAWRWSSVAAGTLSVVGLYWLLNHVVGAAPAILASLLLAFSPMQLYFSQEARPYIVVMAVVVASTAVVWCLSNRPGGHARPERWRLWGAWVIITLLGMYQSYNYALVWLLQAAYLLWVERARPPAVLATGLTALAFVPLLYFIGVNLHGALARAQNTAWLTLPFLTRMALGGDPNRYGTYWGQVVLAVALGGLALMGWLYSARPGAASFERYLALQVVLPVVGFFGLVDGVLGVHIPSFQARQFIVVLPAFYGMVGLGLQALLALRPGMLGRLLAITVWAGALIACLPGLERYWTMTKSPEGDLALALRQQAQTGDAVVSLHYSLDGALSFYTPAGVSVFTKPIAEASGYAFSNSLSILYTTQYTNPYNLVDIRRSGRVWVLARRGSTADIVTALSKGCTAAAPQSFPPFELLRFEDCTPP